MAAITKFSYLKELVNPKVRTSIDGLPFMTEGYQRAKNIKSKYGQTSEIVNAYVCSEHNGASGDYWLTSKENSRFL